MRSQQAIHEISGLEGYEVYVSVTFLGLQRARTNTDQVRVPFSKGTRVADVLAYIQESYPDLPLGEDGVVVAVNNKIATLERILENGDNLIFLPFLGGG